MFKQYKKERDCSIYTEKEDIKYLLTYFIYDIVAENTRYIREDYEQLHANKFDDLEEMENI